MMLLSKFVGNVHDESKMKRKTNYLGIDFCKISKVHYLKLAKCTFKDITTNNVLMKLLFGCYDKIRAEIFFASKQITLER